ncbi:MAG: hypothetical protein J0L53_09435 [Spirochaetes bacterium]|nr:hypothetical protein [Spirochaetota bacterium]
MHALKFLLVPVTQGKVFFLFLSFILPVSANLRAPVRIDRGGSELRGEKAALRVTGEFLEFQCPDAHTGKSNFELFAARACDARIRYQIIAEKKEKVKLTFVFAGSGNVTWRYRDRVTQTAPKIFKSANDKTCSYCPDAMKYLQAAEETFEFEKGEAELTILYRQALSYDETEHGYFSQSKWRQGFSYEIWPIAEWQWAEPLAANLKFSIGTRPGFLGMGHKDDNMECMLEENSSQSVIPLNIAKIENNRREASGRFEIRKKPLRLRCSYAAD